MDIDVCLNHVYTHTHKHKHIHIYLAFPAYIWETTTITLKFFWRFMCLTAGSEGQSMLAHSHAVFVISHSLSLTTALLSRGSRESVNVCVHMNISHWQLVSTWIPPSLWVSGVVVAKGHNAMKPHTVKASCRSQ